MEAVPQIRKIRSPFWMSRFVSSWKMLTSTPCFLQEEIVFEVLVTCL